MRYKIFCPVYKGLRALLYDAALTLQQTDFSELGERQEALKKMEEMVLLLMEEEQLECRYVLPAVFAYEPSVADAIRTDQQKAFLLNKRVTTAVSLFLRQDNNYSLPEKEQKLSAAFVDFLIFTLEHLAHKEKVLNEILWRYYDDEFLKSLQLLLAQNRTPQTTAAYRKWMVRGMGNAEIIQWMKAFEASAPEEVFQALFTTAERELPEQRFRKVLEALTEGMML